MLSTEIVRMVEEYDGWEFPNLDSLKFNDDDEPSYSEVWETEHLSEIYVEDHFPRLNEGELLKLGNVLKYDSSKEEKERNYSKVSEFIRWYYSISSDDHFYTFCPNWEKYYSNLYGHFIEGDKGEGLQPDLDDELRFYQEFLSREHLSEKREKLGKIWFKRFQFMIEEGSKRIPSELINSGDPSVHRYKHRWT